MRQYYINSTNYQPSTDADCTLAPDDPVHDLIASQYMGGLNAAARINERKQKAAAEKQKEQDPLLLYAKETNIKPGTPAWHMLMNTQSKKKR